jgi:hypothetical protein
VLKIMTEGIIEQRDGRRDHRIGPTIISIAPLLCVCYLRGSLLTIVEDVYIFARMEQRKKRFASPLPHEDKMTILIIGGGISGVCCAEELLRLSSRPDDPWHQKIRIILISASETLKEVKSIMKITNSLEEIAVFERKSDYFKITYPDLEIIEDCVVSLQPSEQVVSLQSGQLFSIRNLCSLAYSILMTGKRLYYHKVCICSGAAPFLLKKHPNIIGIRDLEVCVSSMSLHLPHSLSLSTLSLPLKSVQDLAHRYELCVPRPSSWFLSLSSPL